MTVRIRFGDFELDSQTGELYKHGLRIKLADQPFRVLAALLETPGELVTRDQLRQRIWPANTFVDFEQGLNRAVNRVRDALGDSASNPKFIETLPNRGYRFIAAIEHPLPGVPVARHAPTPGSAPAATVAASAPPAISSASRWRPWMAITLAAAAVLAIGILAGFQVLSPPHPVLKWRRLTTDNFGKLPPLTSDGGRIYFRASFSGQRFLAQVPVQGGQPSRLESFPDGLVPQDASGDGEMLAIRVEGPGRPGHLVGVRLADGSARRIGNSDNVVNAAYSPSGTELAYLTPSELWVAGRNGGRPRRLLQLDDSRLVNLVWSRSGQAIRFGRQNPLTGDSAAWEVDSNGSGLHRVLPPDWNLSHVPAGWSPDGRFGIFVAAERLWAAREPIRPFAARAGNPFPLTDTETLFNPSLRIQSRVSFGLGIDRLGELQYFDPAAQEWVPLLDGLSAEGVNYSPDGSKVAYVTYPQRELWVRSADGSAPVQMTFAPMAASLPRWSPDSSKIAFMGFRDHVTAGAPPRVYIVDARGGSIRPAAPNAEASQGDPVWSPDGKTIAYGLYGPVNTGEEVYIRLVDVAAGTVRKLPGSDNLFSPRWSPDGRYIAALAWRTTPGGPRSMLLYDMQTERWEQIRPQAESPEWTADSKALLFREADKVVRFDIATGKCTTIAELDPDHNGGFLRNIGITPAGYPIRTFNKDQRQIYAFEFGR